MNAAGATTTPPGRRRPLLAGALAVVAGALVLALPTRGVTLVLLPGLAGSSGFVLGALICACGLFLWFSPHLHAPIGVATVVLSLASFVTTNVGGFGVGMLLGITAGSLGFAWLPGRDRDVADLRDRGPGQPDVDGPMSAPEITDCPRRHGDR